ncbi:MAG TPA: hypothetical protein VLT88_16125 [Desulfosarcina sp.]|nr:hypothetical protein [Desulfosarcina sp.]
MTRDKINGRRLVGLFLLGTLLFNFPLIHLFNRPTLVLDIPMLYLYLFCAWCLIILLILVISRSKTGASLQDPDAQG